MMMSIDVICVIHVAMYNSLQNYDFLFLIQIFRFKNLSN